MQTRKIGNKHFRYLRVDIFCRFIWFQARLFLLFLDNVTLKEWINMTSAFVFENDPLLSWQSSQFQVLTY